MKRERRKITSMKDENIKDKSTVRRGRKKLLSTKFSNATFEEIKKSLFDNLFSFIRPIYFNKPDTTKNLRGFRIISEAEFNKFGDKNSAFSFTYPKKVKMGRANLKDSPVLYLSDGIHTALYEKGIKANEFYYVSEWHIKPNVFMNTIMLLYGHLKEDHVYYTLSQMAVKKVEHLGRIYTKGKRKAIRSLLKTWCELFLLKDDQYCLSSTIAHNYLYEERDNELTRVDLLIYPSVQKDKAGLNYAFHPDFADKNLYIKVILKQKLNEIMWQYGHCSFTEIGQVSGEKVNWFTFGYKIIELIFMDHNNKIIEKYNESDLYNNPIMANNQNVNFCDQLIDSIGSQMQKDIVDLFLSYNGQKIEKLYRIHFEFEIAINNKKIQTVECKIIFKYDLIEEGKKENPVLAQV